jgi:membrane fusion protein, epimerase transport system
MAQQNGYHPEDKQAAAPAPSRVGPVGRPKLTLVSTERHSMTSKTTIFGGLLTVLLLSSFAAWATLAPLKSAVIANGFVKVSGYRQKVQHLEGGIVSEILVKEGDRVHSGDVLVRLKNEQLAATHRLLRGQLLSALAQEARVKAEQIDSKTIEFPVEIASLADTDLNQFMDAQRNIFKARADANLGSLQLKNERIKQTLEETQAYNALAVALRKQLPMIKIEIGDLQQMWDKKLARKRDLHALKRTEAQIEADIEKNQALIARTRAVVSEIEEDKLQGRRKQLDDLAQERKTVNDSLHDLRQRLLVVEDSIARLDLRAPIDGTVVSLGVNTIGGVVAPRDPVLEIVPVGARLLIEANLKASDIDVVQAGQRAQIQFQAYTARRTNKVEGRVALVSADRLMDSKGQPGFKIDIEVDADEVAKIAGLKLYPGMPADAFIATGERTFARYILAPVFEGINRGMIER